MHCRLEPEVIPCDIGRKACLWFFDKKTNFESSTVCFLEISFLLISAFGTWSGPKLWKHFWMSAATRGE